MDGSGAVCSFKFYIIFRGKNIGKTLSTSTHSPVDAGFFLAMILSIVGFHPRSLNFKLFLVVSTFTFSLFFLYLYGHPSSITGYLFPHTQRFAFETRPGTCPPRAYANGRWRGPHYRTNERTMTNETQALGFAGFEGCASSREFWWHLAADNKDQWDRFPNAQSYRWTVGKEDGCEGFESSLNSQGELDKVQMVKDMVEQGGWLMLGDSITEGHFFSLSCSLYPHVIATPTYMPNSYFDRAWPQNLYLNPASPLWTNKELYFPPHFNITGTPLATFRRVDLLMTQEELVDLHDELYPPGTTYNKDDPEPFKLFSDESAWSLSPKEYMPLFFDRNYSTIVVSTAGHWTVTLFGGYGNEKSWTVPVGAKQGIDGVIDFFGHAMERWADQVQGALDDKAREERAAGQQPKNRQVVVRAYLPGHEDCHKSFAPWRNIQPMRWKWYNWGSIWEYNEVFETLLTRNAQKYSDIHYLAIERPGRLRSDAHATGDCLHIMAGSGVMEGWSHYIWHYVSKELGRARKTRIKT